MTTEVQQLIFNYRRHISLTDPERLLNIFEGLLQQSGFEILGFTQHHFSPQGYTAIWLLAESHLAIHTFPEKKTTYLELSSCSQEKNELFKSLVESSTDFFMDQ